MKRTVNATDTEPEQKKFDLPSEREHLFQVVDIFDMDSEIGKKLGLDEDTVSVKCEIIGGDEEGRSLLQRLSLDESWKGFFATRMFLKVIGEAYKGEAIEIDTDRWVGRQFYARVVHNKGFANVGEYNFDKKIEQQHVSPVGSDVKDPNDIEWGN